VVFDARGNVCAMDVSPVRCDRGLVFNRAPSDMAPAVSWTGTASMCGFAREPSLRERDGMWVDAPHGLDVRAARAKVVDVRMFVSPKMERSGRSRSWCGGSSPRDCSRSARRSSRRRRSAGVDISSNGANGTVDVSHQPHVRSR
jgi:hypothetical protein